MQVGTRMKKTVQCLQMVFIRKYLHGTYVITNYTVSQIMLPSFTLYQQDAAQRQTAGIKLTHRPKISIFTLQGQLVAPIHVKFGIAKGHVGPHGRAKFHANRCPGVECGPQNGKKILLLVKICPT